MKIGKNDKKYAKKWKKSRKKVDFYIIRVTIVIVNNKYLEKTQEKV